MKKVRVTMADMTAGQYVSNYLGKTRRCAIGHACHVYGLNAEGGISGLLIWLTGMNGLGFPALQYREQNHKYLKLDADLRRITNYNDRMMDIWDMNHRPYYELFDAYRALCQAMAEYCKIDFRIEEMEALLAMHEEEASRPKIPNAVVRIEEDAIVMPKVTEPANVEQEQEAELVTV